jgi:head-tail adaptor
MEQNNIDIIFTIEKRIWTDIAKGMRIKKDNLICYEPSASIYGCTTRKVRDQIYKVSLIPDFVVDYMEDELEHYEF